MDKMREEFERWAVNVYGTARMGFAAGFYSRDEVQWAWQAWQASRKALVVELPVAFPFCGDNDSAEVAYVLDILEKLALAGVSYK